MMSSNIGKDVDVTVGRNKKKVVIDLVDSSSWKRQKTEQSGREAKKKPKVSGEHQHRPIIVMEPGDDAVLSYSIMDRVRIFTKSSHIRTCIEGTPSGHSSTIQHIQQRDKWSCGFRNLQMILSAILPHIPSNHIIFQYIPFRGIPSIPTLLQLQRVLEQAWHEGFDGKGADHYCHCIIGKSGPKAHVGAMEVANLARYLGLDATVVQFLKCHPSRRMLPKFVQSYFYKANGVQACPFCCYQQQKHNDGVRVTSKYCVNGLLQQSSMKNFPLPQQPECQCPLLPLYLQWEGHSVTIIGIEDGNDDNNKNDDNDLDNDYTFLILDPIKSASQLEREFNRYKSVKPLRLPAKTLVKKDTQIILWTLLPLTFAERVHGKDKGNSNNNVVTAAEDAVLLHVQTAGDVVVE